MKGKKIIFTILLFSSTTQMCSTVGEKNDSPKQNKIIYHYNIHFLFVNVSAVYFILIWLEKNRKVVS